MLVKMFYLKICSKTYSTSDDPGVKLAVRAALTQMLNSFCLNRQIKAVLFFKLYFEILKILRKMGAKRS